MVFFQKFSEIKIFIFWNFEYIIEEINFTEIIKVNNIKLKVNLKFVGKI
jgi:hypothetical protein